MLLYFFAWFLSVNAPIFDAIEYLITDEYDREQKSLGVNWGKHPLVKNPQNIPLIARAVLKSSRRHEIDPMLILAVAWRESRLCPSVSSLRVESRLGAKGLMQNLGISTRGCDFKTISGQIDCGAKWLKINMQDCKTLEGALAQYMRGRDCTPLRAAKSRVKLYERLKREVAKWQMKI
jgi:hypothetical protein